MFSFLTSLSSSIYFYIIAALLSMTVLFGGLLYREIGKTAESESALVSAINANTNLQKSLNLKDLSCKIDDKAVVEVTEEKKVIDEAVTPVNDKLQSLATVKYKQPINMVNKKENPKDENIYLPDDGILSDNVNRLLNEGWCAVYPTDSECVSK